jgi:hypothetical protein
MRLTSAGKARTLPQRGREPMPLSLVFQAAGVSWRRLTRLIVTRPWWRVPWSPGRLTQ